MAHLRLKITFSNGETACLNATNEEFKNCMDWCINKVEVTTPNNKQSFIDSVEDCTTQVNMSCNTADAIRAIRVPQN